MMISGLSTAEFEAGMVSTDAAPDSGASVIVVGGASAATTASTASAVSTVTAVSMFWMGRIWTSSSFRILFKIWVTVQVLVDFYRLVEKFHA